MKRPSFVLGVGVLSLVFVACAETAQAPPASTAPTTQPPPASTAPITTVAAPQPAAPIAPVPSASAPVAAAPAPADDGVDAKYRTCNADADCVAIDRAGCCNNGRRVAVATSQRDAYGKAFACTDAHPICPTYRRVQDDRVGACDAASHACFLK